MLDDKLLVNIYDAIRHDLNRATDSKFQNCFTPEQAAAIAKAIVKALSVYDKNSLR